MSDTRTAVTAPPGALRRAWARWRQAPAARAELAAAARAYLLARDMLPSGAVAVDHLRLVTAELRLRQAVAACEEWA